MVYFHCITHQFYASTETSIRSIRRAAHLEVGIHVFFILLGRLMLTLFFLSVKAISFAKTQTPRKVHVGLHLFKTLVHPW